MSLIVESNELGGGKWITGFTFVPTGSAPNLEKKCATSRINADSVGTDLGLVLGLNRQEVDRRLKSLGKDTAGSVLYESLLEKPFVNKSGKPDNFTQCSTVLVKFQDGRVVAFKAERFDVW